MTRVTIETWRSHRFHPHLPENFYATIVRITALIIIHLEKAVAPEFECLKGRIVREVIDGGQGGWIIDKSGHS